MKLVIAQRQNAQNAICGDLIPPQFQDGRHRGRMGLPTRLDARRRPIATVSIVRSLWLLAIFGNLAWMAGCVTPSVIRAPLGRVDFAQFKTVAYVVRQDDRTEIGDGDEGKQFARDTLEVLRSILGARLADDGYRIVDAAVPHDLSIDVLITEVKPGSAAARFWVGFGAGRADTEFDASFSADGKALAAFHGGRSFTGMELNVSGWSGHSEISTLAATRSVQQIEEFMRNGGTLPEATHKPDNRKLRAAD